MADKVKLSKRIKRALARNALFATRWIISRMPAKFFYPFVGLFTVITRPLISKKKNLAIRNLHAVFGNDKSEQEIQRIASDCFRNFGRGMIDLIYSLDHPEVIKERVTIEGKEHLDKALEEGKGVILVGGHFGNFILMYLRLVHAGYGTNVIMRRTRDEIFEKYISDFRDRRGIKTIYDLPSRRCVQQSLKALRNNEVLIILLDQNYGNEGGVYVDFFGRKAATATGPMVFSSRTGSPILPIYIKREHDNYYKIVIQSPMAFEKCATEQETVISGVSKITKVIENIILLYPYEWGGWMHNRWKTQPKKSTVSTPSPESGAAV